LPATLEHVSLGAIMQDGNIITGETSIREYSNSINKLFLIPQKCMPVPDTLEAIMNADAVVVGPGSLYTSIIPNLLVNEITEAIKRSNAITIYVNNIMTEQGETDNYNSADHLKVILNHIEQQIFDYVIINNGAIDEDRLNRYRQEQAVPVEEADGEITKMGIKIIKHDLVANTGVAWHDPDKLARTILEILE
jgi:uncharacterized cofD-like protein